MPRPRDGISKACKEAFWCAEVDFSEIFVGCLQCCSDRRGAGQCSSVCHWHPRQPRLASSAASVSLSRGTSVLLCKRLHRTAGKSCGIYQRCAARRPMGALSRSALCSLRLSATPPGLCFGSPKSSRRKGCRGMAGTKADLRSMSCCASSPTRMQRRVHMRLLFPH